MAKGTDGTTPHEGEAPSAPPVTEVAAVSRDDSDEPAAEEAQPKSALLRKLAALHQVPHIEKLAFTLAIAVAAGITLPFLGSIGFFDPWETHYAEVARQMTQRDDYLYPFWKDAYFFSKPVLLFWVSAIGYRLLGMNDLDGAIPWGAELVGRLPNALISILTIAVIFITVRRFWSRRAAVLSSVVLATIPFWGFMSRQAITDMLYVGPMTMAMCLLAIAFFDDEHREAYEKARIPKWLLGAFAVGFLPQLWEIGRTGAFLNRQALLGSEMATRIGFSSLLCLMALGFLFYLHKRGRDPLVHGAAFLTAIATLGKGPHALLLLGMVYFLYFALSGDWRFLKRRAMWTTAVLLYLGVALPWYLVMLFFDGRDESRKSWFGRFVVWDLFGRIGGGVHGDRGTFEYYFRYLSFGMFPWTAALPVALFDAASTPLRPKHERDGNERFTLFVLLWCVSFFVFFTATTTKFHHYIFPVVVPGAILIGGWLDRVLSGQRKLLAGFAGVVVLGTLLIARDLAAEPWQLVDLFTYHYKSWKPDYYFPKDPNWHIVFSAVVFPVASLVILGLASDWARSVVDAGRGGALARLLASFQRLGQAILGGVRSVKNAGFVLGALSAGLVFIVFAVHVYFNNMSQHWSQRWLFETYYALREPGEPIISYQMDWKGETFYAHNTDIQIKKSASKLKKEIEKPGRAFVLVQTDRYDRIKSALGKDYEGKIKVVDRSNKKWFLVLVED